MKGVDEEEEEEEEDNEDAAGAEAKPEGGDIELGKAGK